MLHSCNYCDHVFDTDDVRHDSDGYSYKVKITECPLCYEPVQKKT